MVDGRQPLGEDVPAYIAKQRRLLHLERDTEVAEVAAASSSSEALSALEASGTAITRLSMVGRRSSAGGRVTIELETRGGRVISAPRLSTGDIVTVRAHFLPKAGKGGKNSRKATTGTQDGDDGVLSLLGDTRVEVVLDEEAGEDGDGAGDFGCMFAVIQIGSDVTYKRNLHALDELERAVDCISHPSHTLSHVLFREGDAQFVSPGKLVFSEEQRGLLESLNDSQRDAVELALRAKTLAVIHGPPGSGKSTTLVAYIAVEVLRGSRVLVVAPSNIACDGIAEKMACLSNKAKIKFVRAGHPARVLESVAVHTLEARLAQTDEAELARDIRSELSALDARMKDARSGERRGMRFEQRQLRKELRKRENDALKRLLARVDCVLATTTGAGGRMLHHATATDAFDVVVLDEAGQASEVSALVALLRGKKAVLAGDPFQLAPTVKCQAAASEGLGQTLLDRVFANLKLHQQTTRMLTVQYRMHSVISNWSSAALYEGRLKAAPSVAEHLLSDLIQTPASGVGDDDVTAVPWVLVDTAGCNFGESGGDGTDVNKAGGDRSKSNEGEASIVVDQVKALLDSGIVPEQLGVISPYSGQVSLLRGKLRKLAPVEVATVDSFQGREKEAILISLVRSNDRGIVGFLADSRRLNVAITRARRLVYIVTDSSTTSSDPFISAMIDYASEHGDYRAADPNLQTFTPTAVEASSATAAEDSSRKKGPRKKERSRPRVKQGRKEPKKSIEHSPEDETERKKVEDQVRAFATLDPSHEESSSRTLKFPASLSAYERRAVHTVAEELCLVHHTQGEGPNRFISVSTTGSPSCVASTECTSEETNGNDVQPTVHSAENKFGILAQEEEFSANELVCGDGDSPSSHPNQDTVEISQLAGHRVADYGGTELSAQKETSASSKNEKLKEAALARQERQQQRSREPVVSASTHRRIVDGVLLEGSRAEEAAATIAARARLNSKLDKQSEARRRQPSSKKK